MWDILPSLIPRDRGHALFILLKIYKKYFDFITVFCAWLRFHDKIGKINGSKKQEVFIMIIKQVTVIVENKEGKLKEVMDLLAAQNIDVEAISMADTVDRLIVADPEGTKAILEDNGYEVHLTDVISVKVPAKVGSLAHMLVNIAEEKINLEYMYSYGDGSGRMIICPSDIEKTNKLLADWEA